MKRPPDALRLAARAALLMLCAALPVASLAHAVAVETTPKDHATVAAVPPEIVIRFNARLEKKLTHVKMERADGSSQVLTDIEQRPSVIRCTLPQDLQPGAYLVQYKVLATDGHATQGVLRFTLGGVR